MDAAVSRAVHDLLATHDYTDLSIEQVAAAAGVGKAAIYRRWASKAEMVFALVIHGAAIGPPAEQGTLAQDLRLLTERIVALLSQPAARHALPGLLADLQGDASLATRFQDSFIAAERRVVASLLERAAKRGELAKQPDPIDVHAQLLGTAFTWIFLSGDPPPHDLVERITAAVLSTLTR